MIAVSVFGDVGDRLTSLSLQIATMDASKAQLPAPTS